jgi:hypothetical protein
MNPAFLVLLFLLPGMDPVSTPTFPSQSDQTGAEGMATGYALPEPNLPFPVQGTHPDLGGFILGHHFGGLRGSSWQCGWKRNDGSCLLLCWKSLGQLIDVSFIEPYYQTEYFRGSLIWGRRCGSVYEWYLGNGIAARLDLGGFAGPMRIALAWYPTQGTALELGWDLGRACLDGGIWVIF